MNAALLLALPFACTPDTPDDTGLVLPTADSSTVPMPPGPIPEGSCLAGVVPSLPDQPMDEVDLPHHGAGGSVVECVDDTWYLTGWSGMYTYVGLDDVTFEAWDLLTGARLGSWPGVNTEHLDLEFGIQESWEVYIRDPVLPCASTPHIAFSLTSRQYGQALDPRGAEDTSSSELVSYGGGALGQGLWGVHVDAATADEAWVWAVYPLEGRSYGPFPMVLDPTGLERWKWTIDEPTEALLTGETAVFAVLGCTDGLPIGATSTGT